jgi:hypothetical protein
MEYRISSNNQIKSNQNHHHLIIIIIIIRYSHILFEAPKYPASCPGPADSQPLGTSEASPAPVAPAAANQPSSPRPLGPKPGRAQGLPKSPAM